MQMRLYIFSIRVSAFAYEPYYITALYLMGRYNIPFRKMAIESLKTVRMIDKDIFAISGRDIKTKRETALRGSHRCRERGLYVYPGMQSAVQTLGGELTVSSFRTTIALPGSICIGYSKYGSANLNTATDTGL
jgi:hypothetical protein